MSSHWLEPRALNGPTLQLFPLSYEDAPEYLAALGDDVEAAQVTEHLSFKPPRDLAAVRDHRPGPGDP